MLIDRKIIGLSILAAMMAVPAEARDRCEAKQTGIGYGRTESVAEANATQAWARGARRNHGITYRLREARIVSDIACHRSRNKSTRRGGTYGARNIEEVGDPRHLWNCSVTARPCREFSQIGDDRDISPRKARAILQRNGYEHIRNIDPVRRGYRAQACLDRSEFSIRINRRGRLRNKRRIGACPFGGAEIDEVRDQLRRDGYEHIKLRQVHRNRPKQGFTGLACKNDLYFELRLNRWGDVIDRNRQGACIHSGLRLVQIERKLKRAGYRHINFMDRTPPRYRVRACLHGDSYILTLNRHGNIRSKYSDRRCRKSRGYSIERIENILLDAGYDRIRFMDRKLPRYQARACLGHKKYILNLNRFGKIRDREPAGRCRHFALRKNGWRRAESFLHQSGYHLVRHKGTDGREHKFSACKGNRKYRLTVKRGKITYRKRRKGLSFLECIVKK